MVTAARCVAPIAVVAVVDGALLGGAAAIITSVGSILAVVLSYQHGKNAAAALAPPPADDRYAAELERALEAEREENRALRAELAAQRPRRRRAPGQ